MRISFLVLALGALSCSSPVSYVVVTLQTKPMAAPITDVTDVVIEVQNAAMTHMKTLTYHRDGDPLFIDRDATTKPPANLSVSFSGGESGSIVLVVEVRNALGCAIGRGTATSVIKKGGVGSAEVDLDPALDCSSVDGGVADGPLPFPGCDPAEPNCTAADGGSGGLMTCHVNCSMRRGQCTAAGPGAAGTPCQVNSDCEPGTQCFLYTTCGNAGVCLRFCHTTNDCPQPGDAGVGPGSLCAGPVMCGAVATPYHTCTFSCDPRKVAVSGGTTGCPAPLTCLVVGSDDQVDCACAEASRTRTEGSSCTSAIDCAPGLICNEMVGLRTCRPVCRCDSQPGALTCSTSANDCPTPNTRCTPLTNDRIYGVCI